MLKFTLGLTSKTLLRNTTGWKFNKCCWCCIALLKCSNDGINYRRIGSIIQAIIMPFGWLYKPLLTSLLLSFFLNCMYKMYVENVCSTAWNHLCEWDRLNMVILRQWINKPWLNKVPLCSCTDHMNNLWCFLIPLPFC